MSSLIGAADVKEATAAKRQCRRMLRGMGMMIPEEELVMYDLMVTLQREKK